MMTEDRVREIIREEVVEIVRGQISELFGSIKTAMMEYIDDIYVAHMETAITAIASAVTAAGGGGVGASRDFQYRDSITQGYAVSFRCGGVFLYLLLSY